ncbi:hypothetical protein EBB07_21295 [Paenibacillaceae bacterium]|nr:hypothetical protein EBB07_21295 [Paenibacillaceae bacterium]
MDEQKIRQLLDELDADEANELLPDHLAMTIDRKAVNRIKQLTYAKAGLPSPNGLRSHKRRNRLLIAAAIVLTLTISTASLGYDTVSSAVARWFGLVPGHGIIDERSPLLYRLASPAQEAENDQFKLSLRNATATDQTITVWLDVEYKQRSPIDTREDKERLLAETSAAPTVFLQVNNHRYEISNWQRGIGERNESIMGNFTLPAEEVNDQNIYQLEVAMGARIGSQDPPLIVTFQLHGYDSFQSIEEIGPTVHVPSASLSLTAIATQTDRQLSIDLYPVYQGIYRISELTRDPYNQALGQDDLHVETNQGIKPFLESTRSGFSSRLHYEFQFNEGEKTRMLHIPYVTLESSESAAALRLTLPKPDETKPINKQVSFADSTITVLEAARVTHMDPNTKSSYEALKLTFAYEAKSELLQPNWVYLDIPELSGSGFGWEFDAAGLATTYYYALPDNPSGKPSNKLNLTIKNPKYLLRDGLHIPLE